MRRGGTGRTGVHGAVPGRAIGALLGSRYTEALVELRNPGDEPLVLLALTLAQAAGSAAMPAA